MNQASAATAASTSRAPSFNTLPPSLRALVSHAHSGGMQHAGLIRISVRPPPDSDSSSSTDDDMPDLIPHPETAASAPRRRDMPNLVPHSETAASAPRRRSARLAHQAPPPAAAAATASAAAATRVSARAGASAAPSGRRVVRVGVSRRVASANDLERQTAAPLTRTRSSKRTRNQPDRPAKRAALKKPPPSSLEDGKPKAEDPDEDKKPSAVSSEGAQTCTICMCEPERSEISTIDGCEHVYCFSCIDKWSERENTCPLCKVRFSKIKRVHPQRRKRGSTTPAKNTKKVKNRDQRSDILPSAALEGILANIAHSYSRSGDQGSERFFIARVGGNQASGSRSHGVMAARISSSGGASSFAPPPFFGMGSLDDDDDGEVMGHFIPSFMGAILRSSSHVRRAAAPAAARSAPAGFAAGFGQPPSAAARMPSRSVPPNMPELFPTAARSHASNAGDSMAGRVASNPLEIDDSDDDDVVEVVGIRSR